MIRAAIVGIGRWGRTLIGSVQGKSEAIRFTAGFNRTRANAQGFCTEHGVPLKDSLDEILASSDERPSREAALFVIESTPRVLALLAERHAAGLASFVTSTTPVANLAHWRQVKLTD